VDDAPDTVEIIQKLLSYEGYDVITAFTGEEGVKKARTDKPEVVLMTSACRESTETKR